MNVKARPTLSLRTTLIAQFVLCALLPLLILSVFFISSFRSIQVEQQLDKQTAIAANTMNNTEFALEKATTALTQIARDKNMALAGQSGLFGYSAANTLNDFVMEHSFVAATILFDESGQVAEAAPEVALIIDASTIKQHVNTEVFTRVSVVKSQFITDHALAELLFDTTRNIPIAGELSGHILLLSIPLFLSETERLDSRSTYTGHVIAFILAEDIVKLVYQRSGSLQLANVSIDGHPLTFQQGFAREGIIASSAGFRIASTDIAISADFFVEEREALAAVDALTARFALYAGAIVVLFVALGYLFVRLELKPLEKLNDMVQAFHDGNLSYHQDELPFREFKNVTALLSDMALNIRDYQEDLEAKVTLRTEALENALAEVKKINRELIRTQNQLVESEKMSQIGVLVAGVAHEVNTPIGVCVTATSILDERLQALKYAYDNNQLSRSVLTEFIEQANNCMEILSKNTERAADLIQSFKAVSVDQSSEQQRVININEYIELVLRSLHKELERQEVSVEVSGDPQINVETYPGAFSQILTNLVLNAIKHGFAEYSQASKKISIEFAVTAQAHLELTFKDNGRGVPAKALPKLFDPFFTTSRQTGGSGLGLSIVYNLATQRLGGSINCYCEPGDGLTLFIEFPVKQIKAATS
ncbi:sensor histidine kinase [Alteromonas flava]|uniref:sensor histidine kinase n=1 Tax=Alteromonas flava TaxID=2048003 RepID=UPI000C28FBD2|nr:HAMP domain-containing sensor histidine kinase [Alteromonas flava]